MCCEECADECVCFDVCNICFSPSMYDIVEKEDSDSDSDSDSEDEYEYENYGTQPDGSYMVAGSGMMNGNAYATVEKKDDKYYYCEYGRCASRQYIGDTITWSKEGGEYIY